LSSSSVMRLQNWSLQQGGKLMPQKKKTTWGIRMIYPLIRRKSCREDCIRRTNHWSSLDRVIEEIRRLMLRSAQEVVSKEKLNREEDLQEQQGRSNNNRRGARRTTPEESLGSRGISTLEQRDS
jgi:hypothetical protein